MLAGITGALLDRGVKVDEGWTEIRIPDGSNCISGVLPDPTGHPFCLCVDRP